MISPLAQIDSSAKLAAEVSVGAFSVIEANVTIGKGTIIENNVVIKANSVIGAHNHFHAGVIIGDEPQDLSQANVESRVEIGNNNSFREYVTINRGSSKQDRVTKIGNNNYFMAYAHVGHDCVVGDKVILTNGATLGGHVEVDNHAIIGAFCTVHQFCKVGAYAMLSRGVQTNKDILPYLMVAENKPKVFGLNKIGLQRNGFNKEDIKTLLKAYKIIFRSNNTVQDCLQQLKPLLNECASVQAFIDGLQNSHRGIVR